jgi:type II secretory pathway component PulC
MSIVPLGYPRWSALALAVACLLGTGCDAITGKADDPKPATAEASAEAAKQPATAAATEAPVVPPSLLVGVIPQAIERLPDAGNTWRVDAYVAALIVEQLRKSPLPFTPWRSDGAVPGQPSAGYRVGALAPDGPWAALGLREGDIVQSVNGVPTETPDWTTQALERADTRVTVSVYREDVTITLDYRLVGGMAWQSLVQPRIDLAGGDGDALAVADPPVDDGAAEDLRGTGVGGGGAGVGGGGGGGGGGGAYDGPYSPPRPSSGGSASGGGGGSGGGSGAGGGVPRPVEPKGAVARCKSADVCSIDEAYFDGLVASPSKMQAQADVVPAISNDVFSGYKLKTVRSGTAAHQLGFRSGDKITHVNGRDLTNDAEALAVYMSLSSTNLFKVRYVRGGSTRTKTITVE